MARDTTKYIFNSDELNKSKLVLEVIKQYVKDKNPTYQELKEEFPDNLQRANTIISEGELKKKKQEKPNSFKKKRFFEDDNEVLVTRDNIKIYVSNQWGVSEDPKRSNFTRFLSKAESLGYKIKPIGINEKYSNKLLKLFHDYKSTSRIKSKWIPVYRERCNDFKKIIKKEPDDISDSFLEMFWLKPNNNISSVKPAFLSKDEFKNIKDELRSLSIDIARSPSPSKLNEVLSWAKKTLEQGKLKSVKRAVIHRVFAAANPEHYSTILSQNGLKQFIGKLSSNFNITLTTSGNWADLNSRIMEALKAQGLAEEDVFIVNTFAWYLYEKLVLNKEDVVDDPTLVDGENNMSKNMLNRIFYGPPGTGKTYYTINSALQIMDKEFYNENKNNREILKNKFDNYVKDGYIGFVTFHQSFSYEDFVEGLRAEADDGNIRYFVQDGIFKQLCEKATQGNASSSIDDAILQFIEKMEEGSVHLQTSSGKGFTVTYRGGRTFRIKPDSSEKLSDYPASIENIKKVFRGGCLKDVYNPSYVLSILEYLKSDYGLSNDFVSNRSNEPVVLIIDEINRGNTANIFGELITLIEPSKRAGSEEALSVVLPYSKERFSVPGNLFIIGTMNTADRSLALIDTALRRRFQFQEMLPQPSLLSKINIDGVDVQELLTVINKRIALLYDREHTLGHSFFLSLDESSTIESLREIFEGQILPLLEEYFFEDWEKIRQVLGDPLKPKDLQIIKPDVNESEVSLLLGDGNMNMLNSLYYRDHTALSNPQAYIAIYDRS